MGAPGPGSTFLAPSPPFLRDPGIRAPSALPPGLVSSGKASAAFELSRPGGGRVAVLAVGGPLEVLEAKPGELPLRIRNQKGFVKLGLEHR